MKTVYLAISLSFVFSSLFGNNSYPTEGEKPNDKKVEIAVSIPNRTLSISQNTEGQFLTVNLSGEDSELNWIIFQPNGRLINRIKTDQKITRISTATLADGDYVLMIKDDQGRMLHRSFHL